MRLEHRPWALAEDASGRVVAAAPDAAEEGGGLDVGGLRPCLNAGGPHPGRR